MNLERLKSIYADNGCLRIYVKRLAPNDNSKNQVYVGEGFEVLNIFPISDISTDSSGDWKRERFKAKLRFSWVDKEGNIFPAPHSKLILYPNYPEVRFSGFLNGCKNPPSDLMTQRLAERVLFLGVARDGTVLGYVDSPDSVINNEFQKLAIPDEHGVFKVLTLTRAVDDRTRLLSELRRVHNLNWITSKRLDRNKNVLPCLSPNCGGYTLEAELGISPNGFSEPDYLGWEVKQFGVDNFDRIDNKVITLMTPEPTGGFYVSSGTEAFIRRYGYADKKEREDRINFGGIHIAGVENKLTKLRMELVGFDPISGLIRADGCIALIDENESQAASWSYSSLLKHWNRKHNQACYVPSMCDKVPVRRYRFGNKVILGKNTDFQYFLQQMAGGNIYYDPGIKMENASGKPSIKKRSQFRIKSRNLASLYRENELVDVLS